MSPDIPNWLKQSTETVKANKQRDQVSAQQFQSRFNSEAAAFEKAMSSLRNSWRKLNVDKILSDIKSFIGGDSISTNDYDSHDCYIGNTPKCPNIGRQIQKDFKCDGDWGGTETLTTTIFSINLNASGYRVRYFINSPPRRVVDKNLGFPKNEDELKESIDKFLSSVLSY
jgi:hypothetical protein